MRGLKVKGSVTIEYSLLLPVLLFVYFFLICIGLFQYNKCLFRENTCLIAAEALHSGKNGAELTGILQKKEEKLSINKYLLTDQVQVTYYKQGTGIHITGNMKQINPFAVLGMGTESWDIESDIHVDPIQGKEFLRFVKTVSRLKNAGKEE